MLLKPEVILAVPVVQAEVPKTIGYQGVLADTEGQAVPDGNYSLTFKLYDVEAGVNALWTETQASVAVTNGMFNAILGSEMSLNSLAFDRQYWLGTTVGAVSELTPRMQLTSSPYSLGGDFWKLTGNAGTSPPTNFLGTTDDVSLEVWVNNLRALLLAPHATSPNLIGGSSDNWLTSGVYGIAIGGGGSSALPNRATDSYGTVGGGENNQAGDDAGTTEDAIYATVSGGKGNQATNSRATVGGGLSNTASGNASTIAGGGFNEADDVYCTIGGGGSNNARGEGATIGGGFSNDADGIYPTIGGGGSNTITSDSEFATIGGGGLNLSDGKYTTISGGNENRAYADYATVGGGGSSDPGSIGTGNRVTDDYGTIAGGGNNQAGDDAGTTEDAIYATVGGGYGNMAGGEFSVVPGGSMNTAMGNYGFAAGRRANANYSGCFVWGDSTNASVSASKTNQFIVRASGGVVFYTRSNLSRGVRLQEGSTAWVGFSSSDRALKCNIQAVDPKEVLSKLSRIPISRWSYNSEDPRIQHIGPMSQDFHAAFGLGQDDKHIDTIDADGVALAAIQGMYELMREKDARIDELETRVKALEALISSLAQER